MNIAKKIPDEPSKVVVDQAFDVLCGSEFYSILITAFSRFAIHGYHCSRY